MRDLTNTYLDGNLNGNPIATAADQVWLNLSWSVSGAVQSFLVHQLLVTVCIKYAVTFSQDIQVLCIALLRILDYI